VDMTAWAGGVLVVKRLCLLVGSPALNKGFEGAMCIDWGSVLLKSFIAKTFSLPEQGSCWSADWVPPSQRESAAQDARKIECEKGKSLLFLIAHEVSDDISVCLRLIGMENVSTTNTLFRWRVRQSTSVFISLGIAFEQ